MLALDIDPENSISQNPAAPIENLNQGKLENNLVTFCSNVLKVYAIDDASINLRLSSQFNDKILDVIRVPTQQFLKSPTEHASPKKQTPK